MFSYLSRGYGTWEGIAKLEKPESAISMNCENYVLPPINKEQYNINNQHFDKDGLYTIPQELRLPEVPKSSLNIPKTYTTKSGALLLYSEGCFIPGSRRLKKRQTLKQHRERRHQPKSLMELIMDYKKNGCDPLLLEQVWQRMSSSARDVQPGYSPNRYLNHLSHTFEPDSLKKLVETGSLKSLETTDDGFLPSLLPDHSKRHHLNHRPQPYTTMSLPPVSPSSSILGSFTFYKHALSTGAASMVSLLSVGSDTLDEQLSAKTVGMFMEPLADRLAEVESECGFKRDYDSLTVKEKEDLLTQLLMDVTLHNQRDVITLPSTQNTADSSTRNTDISYLSSDTGTTKSHESLESSVKECLSKDRTAKSVTSDRKVFNIDNSLKFDYRPKSLDSSKSLKSIPRRTTSVCSLPPIVSNDIVPNPTEFNNEKIRSKRATTNLSSSGFSLVADDFKVGLNDVDIESEDDPMLYSLESTGVGLERKDSEVSRLEKTYSEYSLVDALDIQDGESLHQLLDETRSLKSLESFDGLVQRTRRNEEFLSRDAVVDGGVDGESMNDIVDDITNGEGDSVIASNASCDDGILGDHNSDVSSGYDIASDDDGVLGDHNSDVSSGYDIASDDDGIYDGENPYSSNKNDGPIIRITHENNTNGDPDESTKLLMPTIDVIPSTPHITLSSLQDEVRHVAEEVLSRPKSGRLLSEDAEMATILLVERMEQLLGPALPAENVRTNSATPKRVRPLGEPRNSEIFTEKRRIRSAVATLSSRTPVMSVEDQVKQVFTGEQRLEVEDNSLNEPEGEDTKLHDVDDVFVTVNTINEIGELEEAQSLQVEVKSLSPGNELLTVKDLQPQQEQELKREVPGHKERKQSVQKGGKVKKGVTTKRGSIAKGKKKENSIARSRNEQPKTAPFHAGLVPESKPPKGLDLKAGKASKKGADKQTSPELHKTENKTKESVETLSEVLPNKIPVRVDSETGEVEHLVSPSKSEKAHSLAGSPVSREDALSAHVQSDSSRDKSPAVREKTPSSPRDKTPSPRDKTPLSRDKTPSSLDKTLSPHEQKPCPRDRDAVPRDSVNTDVVMENVEPEVRKPSPEVVLTDKQQRANARAAQRAAAAERRRQEVERKRREREEARRHAQEEESRLDVLRKEAEEEMKKREGERRIQKEQEEKERLRLEAEQNEKERQERLMVERQRQAREDWKRKKEQLIAQRKFEEELRLEREGVEREIEEERRREYEEKIAHLEEEEREKLLEERRLDEERIKREIAEEKAQREEERLRMLEERRKMQEQLAAARERQFARTAFLESLLRDFQNLLLDQKITRAFTFSYFDILPWFKDRWRDLEVDRPSSKRASTKLDTVPEEPEIDMEQIDAVSEK